MKIKCFIATLLLSMLLLNSCKDTTTNINNQLTVSNQPMINNQPEKDSSVLLIFHNASKYHIAQLKVSTLYKSYKIPQKKYQEKALYKLAIGATDSLRLDFFNVNIYGISASFVVDKDTITTSAKGSDMYTEGRGILRHGTITYNIEYRDSIMYTNRKIIK